MAEQPELPAETEYIGTGIDPAAAEELLHPTDRRITPEQVAQAMTLMPIDDVRPHPDNNNVGARAAIGESINELGFFDPVIVQQSTGFIISGNHRWEVLRERGDTHVPALVYDVDDLTARRMLAAVNRTARLGHDDPEATYRLLKALNDEANTEYVFDGTGFTMEEFNELAGQFGPGPNPPFDFPDATEPPPTAAAGADRAPLENAPAPAAPPAPAPERPAAPAARAGTASTGMREVILSFPIPDHADLMALLGALRKLLPGDYTTGALILTAVNALHDHLTLANQFQEYLDKAEDPAAAAALAPAHPVTCPCLHCRPPEPLGEPLIPRPAPSHDDDDQDDDR